MRLRGAGRASFFPPPNIPLNRSPNEGAGALLVRLPGSVLLPKGEDRLPSGALLVSGLLPRPKVPPSGLGDRVEDESPKRLGDEDEPKLLLELDASSLRPPKRDASPPLAGLFSLDLLPPPKRDASPPLGGLFSLDLFPPPRRLPRPPSRDLPSRFSLDLVPPPPKRDDSPPLGGLPSFGRPPPPKRDDCPPPDGLFSLDLLPPKRDASPPPEERSSFFSSEPPSRVVRPPKPRVRPPMPPLSSCFSGGLLP